MQMTTMEHRSLSRILWIWLISATREAVRPLAALSANLLAPFVALQSVRRYLRYWRMVNEFKGPTPKPLLGNLSLATLYDMPKALKDMDTLIRKWRTFQMWVGPVRHIVVSKPDDIQVVLGNVKNIYKSHLYKFVEDGMGDGLISSSGEKWKQHRRLIQPSFHAAILDDFVDIFDRHADDLLETLDSVADGEPFDISELFHHVALAITTEASMGFQPKDISRYGDLIEAMKVSMKLLGHRILSPWLHPKFIYSLSSTGRKAIAARKLMTEVEKEIIEKKRLELMEEGRRRGEEVDASSVKKQKAAFLTHLLRLQLAGVSLTDEEIMGEMNTIFLASVDAVKAALDSVFYELSLNSEVQDKIAEEAKCVSQAHAPSKISADALRAMPYTEMVFKEAMRLHPPVWMYVRQSTCDVTLPSCGLVVPEGAQVLIGVKQVHSDAAIYPKPELFDPERFSPERSASRHLYAYLPFANGPRICIGRQYAVLLCKTIMSKIVRKFEISPHPPYKPIYDYTISASHANGTWVRLRPRRH